MFNLGPMELVVLALVGIVVIGPEKLPGLARDAAALLRTVRDLATGARQQLRDELGPEFADVDFRNLNPRTAMQRMVFGEDSDFARDFTKYNPRSMMRDALLGDGSMDDLRESDPRKVLRDTATSYKQSYYTDDDNDATNVNGHAAGSGRVDLGKRDAGSAAETAAAAPSRERPRPRPRPTNYGDDIT